MKGVVALEAHQDVLVQKESCTDPGAGDGQEEPWLVAKAVPDAGGVSRLGAGSIKSARAKYYKAKLGGDVVQEAAQPQQGAQGLKRVLWCDLPPDDDGLHDRDELLCWYMGLASDAVAPTALVRSAVPGEDAAGGSAPHKGECVDEQSIEKRMAKVFEANQEAFARRSSARAARYALWRLNYDVLGPLEGGQEAKAEPPDVLVHAGGAHDDIEKVMEASPAVLVHAGGADDDTEKAKEASPTVLVHAGGAYDDIEKVEYAVAVSNRFDMLAEAGTDNIGTQGRRMDPGPNPWDKESNSEDPTPIVRLGEYELEVGDTGEQKAGKCRNGNPPVQESCLCFSLCAVDDKQQDPTELEQLVAPVSVSHFESTWKQLEAEESEQSVAVDGDSRAKDLLVRSLSAAGLDQTELEKADAVLDLVLKTATPSEKELIGKLSQAASSDPKVELEEAWEAVRGG